MRLLLLMMIWGLAAFLWGSLGAWAKNKAVVYNREIIRSDLQTLQGWMTDVLLPVQKLAADPRLEAAISLPGDVESPPVLRVLYEYAYQHNVADIYVVDLSNDRFTQIAGAAKLRPELWTRLKSLQGDSSLLVGAGERNAVVYVAARVRAPLPHRIFVMVPYTLGLMAATMPDFTENEEAVTGALIPHTSGWAWWPLRLSGDLRFHLYGPDFNPGIGGGVVEEHDGALVVLPVRGLENVWMGVKRHRLIDRMALMPQALLLAWALTLTIIVIWKPIAPLRHRMVAPDSGLARGLHAAGRTAALPFVFFGSRLKERLLREREPPLIEGPGDFLPGDFGAPRTLASRRGFLKPVERPVHLHGHKSLHAHEVSKNTRTTEGKLPDPGELQRQQEERDMKEIIKRCLREGRISLLYQPIFDVASNLPVMHEVFVRLIRPDGEWLTPAQFLPVANKSGLTQALDAAVFKKVLNEHFSGPDIPPCKMALNVGGTSLDGIAYLQELLNNGQHILKHLVFEVRSQEIVRDPRALKLLKDIQSHGGKLSVDYFGGGEAMLQASKVMGFDYVKFDAARFFATSDTRQEMVTLCATAAQAGLPIVVEKVENRDMEDFCRNSGVMFVQGYGLSRPSEKVEMAPLERSTSMAGDPSAPVVPDAAVAQDSANTGADKDHT